MFHLWPQGRIVRICVMALGAVLAFDLGYAGAYSSLAIYASEGTTRQLILGSVYAAIALAALAAGLIAAGPHKQAVQFLIEVQDEMTKVVWPKGGELWRSTLVVAVAIAVIALIVFLSDLALFKGLELIQKR